MPVVSGNSEMKLNEGKRTHENENMSPTLPTTHDIKCNMAIPVPRCSHRLRGDKLSWEDILPCKNEEKSTTYKKYVKQYGNFKIEKHSIGSGSNKVTPSHEMLEIQKYARKVVNSIPLLRCKGAITKSFQKVEMNCVGLTLTLLKQYINNLNEDMKEENTKDTEDIGVIMCKLCKQVFSTQDDKTNHFKRMHTVKYPCKYDKCSSSYSDEKSLKSHQ